MFLDMDIVYEFYFYMHIWNKLSYLILFPVESDLTVEQAILFVYLMTVDDQHVQDAVSGAIVNFVCRTTGKLFL